MTIEDFFKLPRRQGLSAWVENGPLRAYVRKTYRFIEGKRRKTNELASVEIDPKHRGKGLFKELLEYIESLGEAIFVECVVAPGLGDYLIEKGYKESEYLPDSYWKDND